MVKHPRSTKVSLTRQKRQETWQQLTTEQKRVIQAHIRFQHTSVFVDQNFVGLTGEWEFVAYYFNDNYDDHHGPQLYCDCGRRLKHQYVLQNQTGQLIKLGITHFADHLGVPEDVVKQLQTQLHHINFGLDELLQRIRRHAGLNADMRTWFLTHQHEFNDLPTEAVPFIENQLPIDKENQATIVRAYKKATYVPKPTTTPKPRKKKLNRQVWQELFRDI